MKALIVVDLQKDFCPGGALEVDQGDQVVPVINRIRDKFDLTAATRDWHPRDHISFKPFSEGGAGWPAHCVENTPGAEYHKDLEQNFDIEVLKGRDPLQEAYSGFQGTDLEQQLKNRGIDTIYITGLAMDFCVKATAQDGIKAGFKVWVITDGCRSIDVSLPGMEALLKEFNSCGIKTVKSDEL